MADDRLLGDVELCCDLCVAASPGHQLQHVALPVGEPADGVVIAAMSVDHRSDDLGIKHGAAGDDSMQVGDEAVDVVKYENETEPVRKCIAGVAGTPVIDRPSARVTT